MATSFRKMHGLGNDFIVFDARSRPFALSAAAAAALADRRTGIGADTIVILDPAAPDEADIAVRFINADGQPASTCGNATRCVARIVFDETGRDHIRISTAAGVLDAWRTAGGVAVDMGAPRTDWRAIPLSGPADTLFAPLDTEFGRPTAVSMGNPHAVFFVDDADRVDLAAFGPGIERADLFPEGVNVEIATVTGPGRIRMRVWERGVGITRACGSGACATLVAASLRGLTGRSAVLVLDGGALDIAWRDDGHVIMTGPASTSFSGEVDIDALVAP